ncbi:uncharacterized protein [Diadema antillarum]|uniref:uncharacterized protein isoform X4 n=1 Tax=Diadema antillarum TaxID=105358 RepID=UPI003A8A3FD0
MEVFEAKFDYVKQRKDVLSFRKGDKFYIIDKPNGEWWSARKLSDNKFGYVPSVYLEKCSEQFIGRLVPEGRRNTAKPVSKREHDIHLQALAELHQRVKPLPGLTMSKSCPAHVIGHALGMDVPKDPTPPPQPASSNQRAKIPIPDLQLPDSDPQELYPQERVRSPSPLRSSRSPRNSYHGPPPSVAPRPRSPSPLPSHKPKSRNNSFRRDEDSLPYHHICNAGADRREPSDDEDELPAHLRTTPPPPVSSPPPPDYDIDDDEDGANGVPYHHKLNSSGRFIEFDMEEDPSTTMPTSPTHHQPRGVVVDENGLIQPKPLINPVKTSSAHKDLHRELRHRSMYARADYPGSVDPIQVPQRGRSVLEGNELKSAFRDREQRRTKKQLEQERIKNRTSLDQKLAERLKIGEQESLQNLQALEKAATEPEFMKVTLKSRGGSGKS